MKRAFFVCSGAAVFGTAVAALDASLGNAWLALIMALCAGANFGVAVASAVDWWVWR